MIWSKCKAFIIIWCKNGPCEDDPDLRPDQTGFLIHPNWICLPLDGTAASHMQSLNCIFMKQRAAKGRLTGTEWVILNESHYIYVYSFLILFILSSCKIHAVFYVQYDESIVQYVCPLVNPLIICPEGKGQNGSQTRDPLAVTTQHVALGR